MSAPTSTPNNEGGLLFEREFVGTATINKHYIIGGGGVVALVRTGSVTSTEYWHKDALGSVVVRTDAAGVVIAGSRRAFDPWGKASPGADGYRGFTEHEQFDTLGFVHMNGRIYDPALARFMSADPFVQQPDNLQDYNRYSYVNNNPLMYTDPSGYLKLGKLFKIAAAIAIAVWAPQFIGNAFLTGATEAAIAAGSLGSYSTAFATVGLGLEAGTLTGLGSFLSGAAGGFGAGLIGSGSLEGGLKGALSGGLFGLAGMAGADFSPERLLAHAGAGCIQGALGGGGCGGGAASAVAGKIFTNLSGNPIAAVVAGGTVSVIGGGKFANGAVTAAFGYLFNCVAHKCYELRNPEGGMFSFYGTPPGSHFGRPSTLSDLYAVEWQWSGAGETAKIEVGNISLERGGHPHHRTHQDGLDVDIRPVRSGGSGPLTWRSQNYDRAATQRLVDTIQSVAPNATIYFNDPRIRGVQPFPGHDNHLHVRFR